MKRGEMCDESGWDDSEIRIQRDREMTVCAAMRSHYQRSGCLNVGVGCP